MHIDPTSSIFLEKLLYHIFVLRICQTNRKEEVIKEEYRQVIPKL